ncbi:MAG TPA: phosphoribosylaminoimidazolesuccinocarboxamide synthase [candidate division Zixibacteria bacterium]|nr:phosphoribosylaminoimidazolesuccinocarboxamide synthase [candidate division Zixibacteria bacterium]
MEKVVLKTDIKEYPVFSEGKVRDVYDLDDKLLIVTSDRISAFDVVLPNGIPGKGKVLTSMSLFWFDFLRDVVESHLITSNVDDFPADLHKYREQLEGRSMLVIKAERIDIECVVRGYISGSMWKELLKARADGENEVHGFAFPSDLKESDKLPEPIFTPSTKADSGHDENISFAQMCEIVGNETAELCRSKSLEIYSRAAEYALSKGIIIADTKFEFGYKDGRFILIDEVLSPDSSRFWPQGQYQPGKGQPSFDKQFIRDYLGGLDWDRTPPGPELPGEIIEKSAAKYREAEKMLTGK